MNMMMKAKHIIKTGSRDRLLWEKVQIAVILSFIILLTLDLNCTLLSYQFSNIFLEFLFIIYFCEFVSVKISFILPIYPLKCIVKILIP